MKKILSLLLCLTMLFCLFGCKSKTTESETTAAKDTNVSSSVKSEAEGSYKAGDKVNIEMSVKNYGTIKLELYPDIAPITVENFVSLAKSGFYDGLTFHRIVSGFMIQGGDPAGNGTGGSETPIKGEFTANGVNNTLSHTRGVISMARRGDSYDSGSSQFFICLSDKYTASLDGQYASFGMVTEGMDVVDKIAAVEVTVGLGNEKSSPVSPVEIEYVKVID